MKKVKPLPNGRTPYDRSQYLKLPHGVMKHPNFRMLRGNSVKVLLELALLHNGHNNGRLGGSYTMLQTNLKIGRKAISDALKELQEAKFIINHKKGIFTTRMASEFEITFLPSPDSPHPSNVWGSCPAIKVRRRRGKAKPFNVLSDTIAMMEIDNRKLN